MSQMLRVTPHIAIPGLAVPQVQDVPFSKYIGHKTNMGSMAEEQAYITKITAMNSETSVGQQWGKNLNRQGYSLGQIQAPFYRIDSYVEYNLDEQAKFEALSNGVSLPSFLELLAKQGINQRRHQAILYGFDTDTELSQGILGNATSSTLPADSSEVSTIVGYNPGELAAFLGSVAREVMNATYGTAKPVVVASTARVVNYLRSTIIPLTESQKDGAGIDTISGVYNRMASDWLGVGPVDWVIDNTLINSDGKDLILFIAPGLDSQVSNEDSQNLVGSLNSINYNTWYDGAEGLQRFDAPPTLGTFASKYSFKMTPGVTIRSEAVIAVEASYE